MQKKVPAELFFTYVLCVRVNNEDLDKSREWIYRQLVDRVKDKKTMVEAALEVNYWCYEKATYIPSDDRTLAPFGMCNSARGRCGEESTLAVSAMRSVGIPARQCYVPRWAHCDDNHAWVEVWQMAIGIILEHVSQNQYLIRVGLLQLHQRQCLFMQRHFQTWKALQK